MDVERLLIILSYITNIVVVVGWGIFIQKKILGKRFINSFFGSGTVVIYLPSRFAEGLNRHATVHEDFYAAVEIAQFLAAKKIQTKLVHILPDDKVSPASNSVFICGPKSNAYLYSNISYDPNFKFVNKDGTWVLLDARTNYELVSPLDLTPSQHADFAYVNRFVKNNFNIIIIAGIHSIGSKGAASFLTNEKSMKKLRKNVKGNNFSFIVASRFNDQNLFIEDASLFIAPRKY